MAKKRGNKTQAWGIASLALGIIGLLLFFAPYLGIFLSIAAVVFYGIQKKQKNTGFATAGLVTGVIGIIVNGVMLFFIIGFLTLLGSLGAYDDAAIQPTDNVVVQPNDDTIPETVESAPPTLQGAIIESTQLTCRTGEYGWAEILGVIENTGDQSAYTVRVDVDLYNNDKLVETTFTYVLASFTDSPLRPGQSRSWSTTIINPQPWSNCKARFTVD